MTLTGIYNVLAKLRSGESLTVAERHIHEAAAVPAIAEVHEHLDAAVAQAYGWAWPMASADIVERLAEMHTAVAAAEARGQVGWLRPSYQAVRFATTAAEESLPLHEKTVMVGPVAPAPTPWPTDVVQQISALRQLVATDSLSVSEAVARFAGAPKSIVTRHLETLAILGEVSAQAGGRYAASLTAA